MPSYSPPKRATEYIFYVSLVSQANTKLFQNNPTLATGDFKVSKDGGALANLATLPTVTPASSRSVKITLSATEMTADNVKVEGVDAAGAEWCDASWSIQPVVRQFDDLAFPAVSGRSLAVETDGTVGTTTLPKKNTALNDVEFLMVDATTKNPKTGLTVTLTRSIDGGAFGAKDAGTTVAEVANGIYQADLAAPDTNGNMVTYRAAATGADDTFFTIRYRN